MNVTGIILVAIALLGTLVAIVIWHRKATDDTTPLWFLIALAVLAAILVGSHYAVEFDILNPANWF